MSNYKKVSVVIPTIGRLDYLDISIASILEQQLPFFEIIVFDNSKAQNIQALSAHKESSRIRWEHSGNHLGAIQSWNTAVTLCNGTFVVLFGDDDVALPGLHQSIQACLDRSDFVLCPFEIIDSSGEASGGRSELYHDVSSTVFRYTRMAGKIGLVVPGNVFRKEHFLMAKGFVDSGLPGHAYSDDLLWFKLAVLAGHVACAGATCWHYRVHENQLGNVFDLNSFTMRFQDYINLLMAELTSLGVSENEIFPPTLGIKGYENLLISVRFLAMLDKSRQNFGTVINHAGPMLRDLLRSQASFQTKVKTIIKAVWGVV